MIASRGFDVTHSVAEFRLRPWRFAVRHYGDKGAFTYTLLDANWTVAAAARHALRDLGARGNDDDDEFERGLYVVRHPEASGAKNVALVSPRAAAAAAAVVSPEGDDSLAAHAPDSALSKLLGRKRAPAPRLGQAPTLGVVSASNNALRSLLGVGNSNSGGDNDDDGVWLDDTRTLHHYATLLRHAELVMLTLRVRPRNYLVSLFGDRIETTLLDPTLTIGVIKRNLSQQLLTAAQRDALDLAAHVLCVGNNDEPLSESITLTAAKVASNVPLRLVLRPVALRIHLPTDEPTSSSSSSNASTSTPSTTTTTATTPMIIAASAPATLTTAGVAGGGGGSMIAASGAVVVVSISLSAPVSRLIERVVAQAALAGDRRQYEICVELLEVIVSSCFSLQV